MFLFKYFNFKNSIYIILCFSVLVACSEKIDPKQVKLDALKVKWNWKDKVWNDQDLLVLDEGESLYFEKCASCHSINGMGDIGKRSPILISNPLVVGKAELPIKNMLFGRRKMPAYKDKLSNQKLAAIASYVRNAWSNRIGEIVTQKQIQDYRFFNLEIAKLKWDWNGKQWQEAELRILEEGEKHYIENCSGCHLPNGTGQSHLGSPALKGNAMVQTDQKQSIEIVLRGKQGMPEYSSYLPDKVIAAIISYEENAWGNNSGVIVSAEQVKKIKLKFIK